MSEAYTILKQLLLPPGIILVLLAMAFFMVRGTLGRLLLFLSWSLLLLMSLPGLALPLIGKLEPYPALELDSKTVHGAVNGAEAIVVLGAGIYSSASEYGGDTVDARSLERARYAAWLHRRTGLPIYVVGGGGRQAPGPQMVRVLEQEFGVPVAGLEQESRSTRENAELAAPMLRAAGIDRVLLVTHAWHMPRAVDSFRRAGVDVVPAPTYFAYRQNEDDDETWQDRYTDWLPQASALSLSYYAIHEFLGQVFYTLRATLSSDESAHALPSAD